MAAVSLYHNWLNPWAFQKSSAYFSIPNITGSSVTWIGDCLNFMVEQELWNSAKKMHNTIVH